MNTRILLLAISAAAISSCSSVYKSGQTPDDVYYSPGQAKPAYVTGQNQDDQRANHDYTGNNYYSDNYLRFKSSNYYRWSTFDDYYWYNWRYNTYLYDPFYSPIYYGSYYGGNPYTYYNPKYYYYTTPTYSGPRMYNLNTYDNTSRQATYYNPKLGNNVNPTSTRTYSTTANDRGGFLRSMFPTTGKSTYYNPSSGSNSRYNGGTTRSFESNSGSGSRSSSSGGSSSGSHSSGGGSAPVRRF